MSSIVGISEGSGRHALVLPEEFQKVFVFREATSGGDHLQRLRGIEEQHLDLFHGVIHLSKGHFSYLLYYKLWI